MSPMASLYDALHLISSDGAKFFVPNVFVHLRKRKLKSALRQANSPNTRNSAPNDILIDVIEHLK